MNPALTHIYDTLHTIKSEIQKDIIGQDELIEKLIITFFAGGHALLEGVPGLGKTKTIRTFAQVLGLDTKRISFTPDLLPSDLTGSEIYRQGKGVFEIRKGPIFTHILLADEINRTPPKVQSALLEAMEEKRVTIGDETLSLPKPFVVFATQNPLEHEGTYPLPEAQLDRFLMRITLDYPSKYDEKKILMQEAGLRHSDEGRIQDSEASENGSFVPQDDKTEIEISSSDLIEMMEYITKTIRVDEKIYDYVGDILLSLRKLTEPMSKKSDPQSGILDLGSGVLSYGPSTRAGLALIRTSRIHALMEGRDYVMPDDIKYLAHDILDHRIGLSYEALSEGYTASQVTTRILDTVKIP